jgi:hypothetical protein
MCNLEPCFQTAVYCLHTEILRKVSSPSSLSCHGGALWLDRPCNHEPEVSCKSGCIVSSAALPSRTLKYGKVCVSAPAIRSKQMWSGTQELSTWTSLPYTQENANEQLRRSVTWTDDVTNKIPQLIGGRVDHVAILEWTLNSLRQGSKLSS